MTLKKITESRAYNLSVSGLGLLLLCVYLVLTGFRKSECGKDEMLVSAMGRLKKYTLVEGYPFYMKKKKKSADPETQRVMITLNRGVKYRFYTVRNEEFEGEPILSIYNNEKLEFLVGSTFNQKMNKFYSELEFECKTTGNYCMVFNFKDGLEGCALGVYSSLVKE